MVSGRAVIPSQNVRSQKGEQFPVMKRVSQESV